MLRPNLFSSKKIKTPLFIAHRGYRANYPENTLIAFKAALDAGMEMVELDVALSKDLRIVVIHDETLDRTTNGKGPVSDYTLKQLKRLDAGGWFHPDFSGERLPELTEVMELVGTRALLNIEIKSHSIKAKRHWEAIENQIVDLIYEKEIQDRVLISSFDIQILERFAENNHSPALALISRRPATINTVKTCKRIGAVSWHPNQSVLTHQQVVLMQQSGFRVIPYNADTDKDIGRMLDMKVDGIIIDDPFMIPNHLR